MWEDTPLCRRPGLTRFLQLRELKNPPGMTFDPSTNSLSVSPTYLKKLYFHYPTHHKIRPWVEKAYMQRAQSWLELDLDDLSRVKLTSINKNRSAKRHRGNVLAHPVFTSGAANRVQKYNWDPAFVRMGKSLAPTLPERLYGHLDGIVPEDGTVFVEDHEGYIREVPGRVVSSVWVAVNASHGVTMRTCTDMVAGNPPNPEWDVLTPILSNFCKWFKDTYYNQRNMQEEGEEGEENSPENPQRTSPLPRAMIPPEHDIPVVLAFRQKYLLFIWKGGIDGKLVAQYEGYWLPMNEVKKGDDNEVTKGNDVDKWTNKEQLASLRRGANPKTIPRTSGGIREDEDWEDQPEFAVSQPGKNDGDWDDRPIFAPSLRKKKLEDRIEPDAFAALFNGAQEREVAVEKKRRGKGTKLRAPRPSYGF